MILLTPDELWHVGPPGSPWHSCSHLHTWAHSSNSPLHLFTHFTVAPFFPIKHANDDTQGSMPKHPKIHTHTHQLTSRQMHICTQTDTLLHCHWSLAFTFLQGLLAAKMERQEKLQRQQWERERRRRRRKAVKEGGAEWGSSSCCQ